MKYALKIGSYLLLLITALIIPAQSIANDVIKYDKELNGFSYPFEVETLTFNSQNQVLNMRYMDVGHENADKVIVLLHGKNFAGFYWKTLALDLIKQNYRVIIPDQIGFGKSSKPSSYQYSFSQLALNTKRLLEHLNISNADIVGHSMGGMLAVTFAANYSNIVNKLILINPIGLEDYSEYVEFKDTNFFYQRELATTLDKAINYQKSNYYDGKWSSKYEELLIPLKGMLAGDDWNIVAWNNALTYGPIFSENIVGRFSQIKSPTFLIIGTRDKTGPGRAWLKKGVERSLGNYEQLGKNARNLIKGAKLIELEGLGHMPHFEDYDVFMKAFQQGIDK
ncbi:Haloalkane dehalogenase [Zhongshania aliphaticivorans]|uniref:Haloalkane dehalogenase n=1 Tax=Zhongshania aliphaticivorans TaxID=1470434 RepID=A0A5S9NGQ3_9GAMM|nr:alpha/beta hydrolase [Zhongshania aliphaticivorans]CAA0088864.1 Haloalkane dehalogenase [Zhongshania aliphaticivorans]CAA0095301.1 Haloalkane dehalogenase [Zhongshania aliphaticivorans]